jgi:hypothetical protein
LYGGFGIAIGIRKADCAANLPSKVILWTTPHVLPFNFVPVSFRWGEFQTFCARACNGVGEPPTPHEVCFMAEIMAFEGDLWDDALIKHETGHRQLWCQV